MGSVTTERTTIWQKFIVNHKKILSIYLHSLYYMKAQFKILSCYREFIEISVKYLFDDNIITKRWQCDMTTNFYLSIQARKN